MSSQTTAVDIGKGDDRAYATVYNPSFLSLVYDHYVLSFNLKFIWGCDANTHLLPFFAENFSQNHLDIGVATGYFPATVLSRPWRKDARHELTLADINPHPLAASRTRVLSVTIDTVVQTVQADLTEPLPTALQGKKFDSISAFNLFHCMPGGVSKLKAFSYMREMLAEHGVVSGCTVLGKSHAIGWLSRWYCRAYNEKYKIFNNWTDTREQFEEALKQEFEEVELVVIGMMLLFRARKPKGNDEVLINLV